MHMVTEPRRQLLALTPWTTHLLHESKVEGKGRSERTRVRVHFRFGSCWDGNPVLHRASYHWWYGWPECTHSCGIGSEPQRVCDLGCIPGVGEAPLVGEHLEDCIPRLTPLASSRAPPGPRPWAVIAVHHEDQALCVLEVVVVALSWPPTSHRIKLMFSYSTFSTLKVGMVVIISPNFSLYRIDVFLAASRPTMMMGTSFVPTKPFKKLVKMFPMLASGWKDAGQGHLSGGSSSQALVLLPTSVLIETQQFSYAYFFIKSFLSFCFQMICALVFKMHVL